MILKRYVMPLFFIIVSVIFFIGSLTLKDSPLGNPDSPKYFPAAISAFLFIMSVVHFIQVLFKDKGKVEELVLLLKRRSLYLIGVTILLCIMLAFIFERIGYILSMIIFLGALLFAVNGRKKWLVNIIITIVFSLVSWFIFAYLLGVSLP